MFIDRVKGRRLLNFWYNESTHEERDIGNNWYNEAREYSILLSNEFELPQLTCAGVISALSPNNRWPRNKIDAHIVLTAVKNNISFQDVKVCTYNRNKIKAFRIAEGDKQILEESPKTYSFAHNISGLNTDKVTIDKWHLRAVQTSSMTPKECKDTITHKQYRNLEADCQKVAKKHNINPSAFQAIIWITIRNRWT